MSAPDGEDAGGKTIPLGDGDKLVIHDWGGLLRSLRHHPGIVAMLDAKAQAMAADANALAQEEGAEYAVTVVADWPDSSRARANVWTKNKAARRDDALHSTLFKVLARHGGSAAE